MAHIRNELESLHIVIEDLVRARSAPRRKRPHDIFTLVHVNIILDENETMNEETGLGSENEITYALRKVLRVRVHSAQLLAVNLKRNPCHLAFGWCKRVFDG